MSICLSVPLSNCLSICLSVCPAVRRPSVYLPSSVRISLRLVSPPLCGSLPLLFALLSFPLSISLSLDLATSIYLSICLSILLCMPIYFALSLRPRTLSLHLPASRFLPFSPFFSLCIPLSLPFSLSLSLSLSLPLASLRLSVLLSLLLSVSFPDCHLTVSCLPVPLCIFVSFPSQTTSLSPLSLQLERCKYAWAPTGRSLALVV